MNLFSLTLRTWSVVLGVALTSGPTLAWAVSTPRLPSGPAHIRGLDRAALIRPKVIEFAADVGRPGSVRVIFDQPVNVNQVRIDYLEDAVQINIQNAVTAHDRILSLPGVGAPEALLYQYSSGLVRIQIRVQGKGEDFEGSVKVAGDGAKAILLDLAALQAAVTRSVVVPAPVIAAPTIIPTAPPVVPAPSSPEEEAPATVSEAVEWSPEEASGVTGTKGPPH